jgi:hypothetical protein
MRVTAKDKIKIVLGMAVAVLVMFTVGTYFSFSGGDGHSLGEMFAVVSAVVLSLAAIYYIWERKTDVDAGMPFEDELSKKIMHRAGYYAYFASMYTALTVSMFEENIAMALGMSQMELSTAVGIIVLVPAIMFFVAIFYFKRRGDV